MKSTSYVPPRSARRQFQIFLLAAAAVILAFALPLYRLARFSIGHELYSHIVLIPLISLYLIWQDRAKLPPVGQSAPRRNLAFGLFAGGGLLLAFYALLARGMPMPREDYLALTILSFLLVFAGVCSWFLGRDLLRALAFPLGFLIFMVPLPIAATEHIETFLQHGSAWVARGFFKSVGTTVFAEGLLFQLPGISLQVAPECSGIHSSLALLITSVLAGYFFLRSPGRRAILALAVIPLALIRNGFRVFVIGELCVHVGPEMIHSYIHRKGGPIFFLLSLIPFFLLLVFLVRSERKRRPAVNP